MAIPTSDNFNSADSGTLGANWTARINNFNITSFHAVAGATADCVVIWSADSYSADQLAKITVFDYASRYLGPTARVTSSGNVNGYAWITDSDFTMKAYRIDNSVFTNIYSSGVGVSNGDTMKLKITGSGGSALQTYYKNDSVSGLTTTSDSTYSSGQPGMYGNGVTTTADDFSADIISSSTPFVPFQPWYQMAPIMAQ